MFVDFFFQLKAAKVPVTIREYLMLLEAMEKGVFGYAIDDFYWLARAALVKDEKFFDKFDQAFSHYFRGMMNAAHGLLKADLPEEWLKALAARLFSPDELEKLQQLGLKELMDELAKRLQEQSGRHQGGSRWIGTGGTSPFGNSGINPAGVRIGGAGGQGKAVKIWDKREFRALAGDVELGTRNIKVALRRLRKFVREGAEDEFDLGGTIRATAENGGWLDIKMVPERKNRVKVLLFLDIGGSMDSHIRISEELFSAARGELKHLEYFYFHNCLYERVWRSNKRGYNEFTDTWEVLNTYGPDYKVIFVGDATMSTYEITEIGGSIEHWNEETGETWLDRVLTAFPDAVWLNPVDPGRWHHTPSVRLLYQLIQGRMFPLTLEGLDRAMSLLRKRTSQPTRPV
ncbi:MAG: VWA domain-containing protein [Alphaproteobacteria bacterium]|nr:VWA domain-containing protein [Alphaproteobacteria bacterium]